jgi:hypothetical protein
LPAAIDKLFVLLSRKIFESIRIIAIDLNDEFEINLADSD